MLKLQTVAGFLITAGIIWLGLSRINLADAAAAFLIVRGKVVVIGAALVLATMCVFSLRWRILIPAGKAVPVRFFFAYLTIGYMTNAILPLRLGDLVRAYLLGRRHGIAVSATLSSVVLERVCDVVTIVAIGLVVSTMMTLPQYIVVGLRVFAFVGLVGMSIILVLPYGKLWIKRIRWLHDSADRFRWFGSLLQRFELFCEALTVLHDWRRLLAIAILSLAGWCILAAGLTAFAFSVGLDVPFLAGAVMMVATSLGAAIPSAPGSMGVYHVMIVLALSVWNIPTSQAVAVGIIAHSVTVGLQIVLGVICAWCAGIRLSSLSRISAPLS